MPKCRVVVLLLVNELNLIRVWAESNRGLTHKNIGFQGSCKHYGFQTSENVILCLLVLVGHQAKMNQWQTRPWTMVWLVKYVTVLDVYFAALD